jgi:hypothetical protein
MQLQIFAWKYRLMAAISISLFCGLLLNSSTVTLAEPRGGNWRKQNFSAGRGPNCETVHNRAQQYRDYGRDRGYQRIRGYDQDRRYDRYRDNRRYQDYDGYRDYERDRGYGRERTGAKSALIIAGSSGAGAAVGAIAAGSKGAAIGAIAGGVAGLIYDRHTDNR